MAVQLKKRRKIGADYFLPLAIFVGTLSLLLATTNIGFTRDEGFYFHAAGRYIGWFEELWKNLWTGDLLKSFTKENIDRHWSYNPEHPVLMKAAFALSHKLFHELLGWTSHSTALRFPAMVLASSLTTGVYLFTRKLTNRTAGLVAAGALLFQPRFFFHAHLAVFDVPIAALWFWVVFAYWQSFDSRKWALATGLLFGLALSVKLNAFFLPIVLVSHWVLTNWRQFRLKRLPHSSQISLPKIPAAFWSMAILGPLLFIALWPRHWFDTVERVAWYMNFHLQHEHYMVYYFGQNLQIPPFPISYPTVMTILTVPTTILFAALLGAAIYFRKTRPWQALKRIFQDLRARQWPAPAEQRETKDKRGTALLIAINLVFPIALISMPNTPIFGGTKHWMPAMPYLAILCGYALWSIQQGLLPYLKERFPNRFALTSRTASVALILAILAPAAYATAYNHPHGTAYYNELIGSYRGAADAKLFRQFWGHSSRHALPVLNEIAPEDASVWTHNTIRMAWRAYQTEGLARQDLKATPMARSDFALYHQQKAFIYQLLPLWENYGTRAPVHVVSIDGVPLLSLYERPDPTLLKYPDARHP